ncbi:MAG: CoA pyrophosphatase [Pseudomonadales bacterium]|nr:CoA pyrophosphatase [Pseudomonadales bacterium]
MGELRNPHIEPPVPDRVRESARESAVLIGVVQRAEPTLLVTRRHSGIRFAGQICFPGGTIDEGDGSPVAAALRESEEEIALVPDAVEVLGELGHYYTQSGYRITPVVGLIEQDVVLRANPGEVSAIYEVPLSRALSARHYQYTWRGTDRAHLAFVDGDVRIAGPTVSLLVGLYEAILDAGV